MVLTLVLALGDEVYGSVFVAAHCCTEQIPMQPATSIRSASVPVCFLFKNVMTLAFGLARHSHNVFDTLLSNKYRTRNEIFEGSTIIVFRSHLCQENVAQIFPVYC
jgi:hypothetical protein